MCCIYIYYISISRCVWCVLCVCVYRLVCVLRGRNLILFFLLSPLLVLCAPAFGGRVGSEMRPGLRNPEFPDIFSSGNSSFGLCIYMGSIPGAPSSINRFLRFPSSSSSSSLSPHSTALSSFPLQDPILIYLFIFIYFLFFFCLSLSEVFSCFFLFYIRRKIRSISLFFSAFAFPSLSLSYSLDYYR